MPLKFFSREVMYGDMPDEEADAIIGAYYAEHLPRIAPSLPPAFSEMARHVASSGELLGVHDARLRRVTLNLSTAQLRTELRAGDLSTGYYDLDLDYAGIDVATLDREALRRVAEDPALELVYHEADIDVAGRAVHRLLFWPHSELELAFRDFSWRRTPVPQRAFLHTGPRYAEITPFAG